jgi:class 3 adenylate cyclase/predicted ATPase
MREFELNDAALDELVEELVDVQQVAALEGKVLSWIGATPPPSSLAKLETQPSAERPSGPTPPPQAAEAERRQITVLFCDIVDSTRISAGLDAEVWREMVRGYQEAANTAIERYGGRVAQYLGDGILVYFGWPTAHEDDAERAVRAGFGIRVAIEELSRRLAAEERPELAVRIGVHTGPVVVGEMGSGERRETLALGETTNVGARLQGVAQPNTIVASEATLRLVQGLFLTRFLGEQELKGLPRPVPAFEVIQASGVRSRLDAPSAIEMVGREQELGLLLDRWEQVREGSGQAVLLSGEAGVGKTRLVLAFRERLAEGTPHTWLECRCSPYTQDSALYPVTELLHQALAFTPSDGPAEKRRQLEAALRWAGFQLEEALPLMAELLVLGPVADYAPLELSPEARRRRTLEILSEWLLRLGNVQPVVLLFEDLQWADPSTLELLNAILEQIPTASVLALYSHRPEFRPPWTPRSQVTPILLSRFTRRQARQMIECIAGPGSLPEPWLQEIVRRADGVPLFVEELTKAVIESSLLAGRDGAGAPDLTVEIPATLQDPLMARLDQLGPVKELAQLCSCIGREFSYWLLLALEPRTEEELREVLARAVRSELFYQRGAPPSATYVFKHALIQEAAYQTLVMAARRRYHQRIAETLAARFPEFVAQEPELLARHFSEAGDPERALPWWQRAAQRAIERSAHVEAARHVEHALHALESLPETPERHQQELELRTLLGVALMTTRGYGAHAVADCFARARELSQGLGDSPRLVPILFGLWLFYMVRADRAATAGVSDELLALARRLGDDGLLLEANSAAGVTASWQARHAEAVDVFTSILSLYDPVHHRLHAFVFGQDPAAYAHVFSGMSRFIQGKADAARADLEAAVAGAESLGHPFTLGGALIFYTMLVHERGEAETFWNAAERVTSFAQEQSFPLWMAYATVLQGRAWFEQGQVEDGLARMRAGLRQLRDLGAHVNEPYFHGLLLESLAEVRRPEEGLAELSWLIESLEKRLDVWWGAELHRRKGELLALGTSSHEAPQASFERALEIARSQGALTFELRAAVSLARLWRGQGRRADARALLAPIDARFTEGFTTRDLVQAKALLEELA